MKNIAYLAVLFFALSSQNYADTIKLYGSESVQSFLTPILPEITQATGHTIEFEVSGSSNGYVAANKGQIGMASRPPNSSERTQDLELVEIGIEALVIGVNFTNNIGALSSNQIKDIYSGRIQNWNDVSASFNHEIKLYGPETKHGTFDFFVKAFDLEAKTVENLATLSNTHRKTMRYISTDEGNIGFFTFGSWKQQQLSYSSYVNLVAVNGVTPTDDTVESGSYPLVQPLYLAYSRQLTQAEKTVIEYLLDRF